MALRSPIKTFCYFGLTPGLVMARDSVLLKGLENRGIKIINCTDSSPRFWAKFVNLIRKHHQIKNSYDVMLVGYLSNMLVPLARLISRHRVVYNALNSMYEGAVLDRRGHSIFSFRRYLIWFIDFMAFHLAHLVLVESEAQSRFLQRHFWISKRKLARLFTGADNTIFHPDHLVKKRNEFTAVFRGWFVPATGVEYVLEAARLLKDGPIKFLLIGRGPMLHAVEEKIEADRLTNVELITAFLSEEELRRQMLSCYISLGQFSDHPRLDRTIQNKTFETLALGLPYITRDSVSNRELLTDNEDCLFVKAADAKDLAEKILNLKNSPDLRGRLAKNSLALYNQQLTPQVIAARFLQIITESQLPLR